MTKFLCASTHFQGPANYITETEWRIYGSPGSGFIGYIIPCRLFGEKVLPAPVLFICYLEPWEQLTVTLILNTKTFAQENQFTSVVWSIWQWFASALGCYRMLLYNQDWLLRCNQFNTVHKYKSAKRITLWGQLYVLGFISFSMDYAIDAAINAIKHTSARISCYESNASHAIQYTCVGNRSEVQKYRSYGCDDYAESSLFWCQWCSACELIICMIRATLFVYVAGIAGFPLLSS